MRLPAILILEFCQPIACLMLRAKPRPSILKSGSVTCSSPPFARAIFARLYGLASSTKVFGANNEEDHFDGHGGVCGTRGRAKLDGSQRDQHYRPEPAKACCRTTLLSWH